MNDLLWMATVFVVFHGVAAASWRAERKELINKIMSRNYHDYQFSQNIDKTLRPDGETMEKIKVEDGLNEDLAPIQGFGMN